MDGVVLTRTIGRRMMVVGVTVSVLVILRIRTGRINMTSMKRRVCNGPELVDGASCMEDHESDNDR